MSNNQLAMVMIFAGGFLFGGVATLLLRWWRGRKWPPIVIDGENFYREAKRVERNRYLGRDVLVVDGPSKPIPYKPQGGPVPNAPVTREEFERLSETVSAFHAQARERILALEDVVDQRPNPAPEPLAPGVRVWRRRQHVRLLADGCFWGRESDSSWYTFEASERWTMEHCAELHGHERDEVVKDWMNRGNV